MNDRPRTPHTSQTSPTSPISLTSLTSLTSNGYGLDPGPGRLGRLEPVDRAELGDRQALRARYARDGYLFLRGFFAAETVRGFRRHYFRALAPSGLTAPGTDPADGVAAEPYDVDRALFRTTLFGGIVPGAAYAELCAHPRLVAFYRWFFGVDEVHLHRRKIIRHNVPGEQGIGSATQAHYDLVYLREGTENVLSSWIPLGDCPVERGGLVYLEGSHHRVKEEERSGSTRRPAASLTADLPGLAEEFDSRWLIADYAAGDMVVHSPYLVHAALDNRDPGRVMRLSTDIRYQPAAEPVDARWQRHWHDRDGL
ncbi:phytanoyl-CoA dioxygenase [Streptomyces sp. SID8379]|uniref:phytanoyl-CoA dioxygenase family protein n=1 Tax=unclassified Streptomyces TaxID=2593676 RepID=UPI000D0AB841|nr:MULTISPECIES: phytanoyl-CoA dioxygenase family protein [unclassified Streptomyces]MYW69349.1 phytanoyl-CoA dioxygenase [Streptomyces sp. SID8379]MYW69416.1 phytanoyl-CoA dioxygenase [Streptomyces sp. SID8379]